VTVGHGAYVAPDIDDFGEAVLMVRSAAGWWHYDLTLTVTPDGQPVLTAALRAVAEAVGVVNLTTENCHPLDGFDGW
jgi:hypothetical protein